MNETRMTGVSEGLIKAVRQDPRKTGMLMGLVVVMLLLWGRAMIGEQSGPSTAVAAPSAAAVRDPSGLDFGPRSGSGDAIALLEEWTAAPLAPVGRNLFQVNLDYFARDASRPILNTQRHPDGFWDELAKSLAAQADQRKERQILLDNLQRQAAQLKIQTIVMGEKPRALINGELVGEGDIAASFRVVRIESRRVVVEREGVRMEILMN